MDQDEAKDYFLLSYDTYADAIYRFVLMTVSDKEKAEDITQDVFMRFWQALREGTVLRNDRALLYAIARNLVIDWYRKKKESSLDALTDEGIEFEGSNDTPILESAMNEEVLRVVYTLDEPSRESMLLRFVEGFSPAEIAALRGESANAVSVRINRALKKVREQLHV
jgi:RNA polymerase sigma-70 factor (ECF subfamily)